MENPVADLYIVEPGKTLVLITSDEIVALLPNGNWTRTPLKGPQDLAAKVQDLAYRKLVIDHIEARQDMEKAKRDLAAADLKHELDLVAPPCPPDENPPAIFQSKNLAFSAALDRNLKKISITRLCKLSKTSATSFYRWTDNGWADGKFWDDLPQDLLDWIELVALSFRINPDTTAAPPYRWHRKGGEGCR